jgi:hypothetical protein
MLEVAVSCMSDVADFERTSNVQFKYSLRKNWRAVRKIFGLKGEEAAVDWRRLHNDELCDLYTSPNTIQFIASRRMDGTCGAYRREERQSYVYGFGGETRGKETTWKT